VSAPASLDSQNMTVSISKPRRSIWAPLLVLFIILAGLGAFIWMQMDGDPDPVKSPPSVASTSSTAPESQAPESIPAAPATQAPVTASADAGVADAAPPPPDAAPPSLAATGTVKITSAPAGAEVREGDTLLGRTPLTVALPVGEHRLRLVRGRAIATLKVNAIAGAEAAGFHAVLRRPSRRAPATEAPKPVAVESAAPVTEAVAAPETKAPKKTVRMKLLDEDSARDFNVKSGGDKPAAPATRKPSINLLD
jgi:hypothetical protein